MMTVRDAINSRRRRAVLATFGGWLLFAIGAPLASVNGLLILMPALGFLGFIGGAVAAYVIRCPRCRHFIGQLGFMGRARPLSLAKAVRYCPFCALDFDTELELVRTA